MCFFSHTCITHIFQTTEVQLALDKSRERLNVMAGDESNIERDLSGQNEKVSELNEQLQQLLQYELEIKQQAVKIRLRLRAAHSLAHINNALNVRQLQQIVQQLRESPNSNSNSNGTRNPISSVAQLLHLLKVTLVRRQQCLGFCSQWSPYSLGAITNYLVRRSRT